MLTGSCHCNQIQYRITGKVHSFEHCHCDTCRKINGTVYGSSAVVSKSAFEVTQGEDALSKYRASPSKDRYFCSNCGSHVFAAYNDGRDDVLLRVGTLQRDHGLKAEAHIFVSDQPDWYEIRDDLPQHEGNR